MRRVSNEPVQLAGLIMSAVGFAVVMGWIPEMSPDQSDALQQFLLVAGPYLSALVTRQWTSPASRVTELAGRFQAPSIDRAIAVLERLGELLARPNSAAPAGESVPGPSLAAAVHRAAAGVTE